MANDVRIEVKTVTEQAEKGFASVKRQVTDVQKGAAQGITFEPSRRTHEGLERLDTRIGSVKKEGFAATNVLGDFNKALGIIGIGGLSVGFALKNVISTMNQLAQSSALTQTILEGLGPDFVQNFLKNIEPKLQSIAREFGFTANDAKTAFGIISRITRNATLDVDALRAVLALARLANIDVKKAAEIWGQALSGNLQPLRDVIGEVESLDQAQDRLLRGGKEATTVWHLLGGSLRQAWQDLINFNFGLKDVIKVLFPFLPLLKKIMRPWQVQLDVIGNFFKFTLPEWWDAVVGWFGKTTSVVLNFFTGTIPNFIGAIWNWTRDGAFAVLNFFTGIIPAWLTRIWDWIRNGINIGVNFLGRGLNIPGLPFGNQGREGGRDRLPHLGGAGLTAFRGGGGGGGVTININGNLTVDNESRLTELADLVFRQIEIKQRRGLSF